MAAFDYLNQSANGEASPAASPPVSTTESTNAQQRTQQLGALADALASGSSEQTDLLNDIAAAITSDIIGGSTGSVDNRALRSKGTGGRALDASPVAIDDSSNVTPSTAVMALRTNTSLTNTLLLQAYDVDGAAYVTVATATAANVPTFNLMAGTTLGGVGIAVVNQIPQMPTLWLFPEDGTFKVMVKSAFAWTITETTTITTAGTSTVTISINGTPLGGTANSASTSESSQAHSSSNAVAAGDDVSVTFASTSSDCVNLSLNIAGTIVLAAT